MRSESDARVITVVGRLGSFIKAADTLGVTQPALSRRLQTIEEALGVKLFDRSARAVQPTVFGEAALRQANAVLQAFDDLRHDITLLRDKERGELTITTTMYPAHVSVARAVAELVRRYPKLKVHLTVDDQLVAARKLRERDADIGIVWIPGDPEADPAYRGLMCRRLPRRRHVFYCRAGHPLAMFPEATPAQIAAYPLVGFHMGPQMLPFRPEELGASGSILPESGLFEPQILVNSYPAARAVVLSSNAVSWAPMCLLRELVDRGEIVALSYSLEQFVCGYDIAWSPDRMMSPAGEAFAQIVTEFEQAIQ
ncbi:MAG: LysR family transcriptional regulator [Methylobacteriaceae bacterium]|nr:LysR family transcriptional regulator [Rhodoblastus sp.]MCC0005627.1 LysR family transcriptional regulator [Methylobacteriaceae bacterium]